MPRKLRVEYAGALYHPPSPSFGRTGRREDIYLNDADRQDFLKSMAEVCLKTGWQVHAYCLIKPEMLEKIEGRLGDHHSRTLRREMAETKAERIVKEELKRMGWTKADLESGRNSDPGKLPLAARLRQETTLSIKRIAARVQLGTSKSANARLHEWMGNNNSAASANRPRAKRNK